MAKLTLSLGSNLGDRQHLLQEARRRLSERFSAPVYESEVIETQAWGKVDQPAFLNQIVILHVAFQEHAGDTPAFLHEILSTTQAIEAELARERNEIWGPRTIDIDLIFLDDLIYEDELLSLPHPWWKERTFVTDLLPPGVPF